MVNEENHELTDEISDETRRQILQEAGLFISDPRSFPGLKPRLDALIGLDLRFQPIAYNTASTIKEKVRCSVCDKKQPHYHGFIVRTNDGAVGLVGKDCGENHFFGSDGWKRVEAKSRIASEAAIFERRWGPTLAALQSVVQEAQMWEDELSRFNVLKCQFRSTFPQLFQAIAAQQRHGELWSETRVEVPFVNRNGERHIRIDYIPKLICNLKAHWFFENSELSQKLRIQIIALNNCISQLKSEFSPQKARHIVNLLRKIKYQIAEIADQELSIHHLFSESTLISITKWARMEKIAPGNYRYKHGRLKCSDSHYDYGNLQISSALPPKSRYWSTISNKWPQL